MLKICMVLQKKFLIDGDLKKKLYMILFNFGKFILIFLDIFIKKIFFESKFIAFLIKVNVY